MGDYLLVAELSFPAGRQIDFYFHKLDATETLEYKEKLITESENWLNNRLRGKTVIPAAHAKAKCKQICLEYARFLIQRDNYLDSQEGMTDRIPTSDLYRKEADRLYDQLTFGASADIPVAGGQNIGDGTITNITVDDVYTRTEDWILIFNNSETYEIRGSVSGYLYSGDVTDNSGKYPVQEDGERLTDDQRRVSFTLTAGTADFEQYDEYHFRTYGRREGKGKKLVTIPLNVIY